ncbi:dCTP deaminase [Actinomadura sp. NPDC048955]|uniref:dCTP deaminase n=1 Tax=Actinomadura TaxID=1988 RepID=UPI0021641603|nr:dCTP deaminase [Actinomadura glauciflava]MCR3742645.1 dCTP deaminase [Actinomadura glauciflava]
MILSDTDIRKSIADGSLTITPFDERLVKRNSYLLRLHSQFRRISGDAIVDTADPVSLRAGAGAAFRSESVVVTPDALVLACSRERIGLPADTVGILSGISNVARLGVMVHCTSQLVNAEFGDESPSRLVLEVSTVGGRSVRLYAGTPLCHLVLCKLVSPTAPRESSRRTGQEGPDPSELLSQFGHFYAPTRL